MATKQQDTPRHTIQVVDRLIAADDYRGLKALANAYAAVAARSLLSGAGPLALRFAASWAYTDEGIDRLFEARQERAS